MILSVARSTAVPVAMSQNTEKGKQKAKAAKRKHQEVGTKQSTALESASDNCKLHDSALLRDVARN